MFFFKAGLVGLMVLAAAGAAGAEEFPTEVRFLKHFPVLMKGGECLDDGRKMELPAWCEVRVEAEGSGLERAFYIVGYDGGGVYSVSSAILIAAPADPPKNSLPEDLKAIVRGECKSGVLKLLGIIAPTRCEFSVLRSDDPEFFYLRIFNAVPGGTLFLVRPGHVIFPPFLHLRR